ncbi:hypothetical protein GN244_ATG01492 [Phytophthora infestans]|uniref:Uncharacterized protein n=1 Tax=Phytophthora infestans TaxID=4787 RepID=A0A833TEI7_PHYIN|nr:hypothetical protein GN244_ATG01492 [Phytophthora infestans]
MLRTIVIREEPSLRKRAPGGRLLPTRRIDAVRQIDPDIGLYDALPGQITPGWSAVPLALDASVDEFEHLQSLVDPQQVQSCWIDAIYVPHSSVWWDECLLSQGGRIYWVAAFTNSVGFAKCTSAGCRWLVRIPAGELHMRMDYSVIQTEHHQSFKAIFSKNTLAITIEIVSPPSRLRHIVSEARRIWAGTVGQFGASKWIIHPQSDENQTQRSTLGKHPYFEWYTPQSDPGAFPLWWSRVRQQLGRLDLAIYTAPVGRRRYLTMTTCSVTWAEAMSYTKCGARRLHNQLFLVIWETLHEYWKISCKRCNTESRRRRRKTLCEVVNAGIVSRRKKWAKKTNDRVTHAISTRNAYLQSRGRR